MDEIKYPTVRTASNLICVVDFSVTLFKNS